MKVETALVGGTLVTSERTLDANIGFNDGKIKAIKHNSSFEDADTIIDASGKYILPGLVDPHTHIAGYYSEDNYETASAAAAIGGVTTCITFAWQPWASTGPDSVSIWEKDGRLLDAVLHEKEKGKDAMIDFGLHGGITREDQAMFDNLDEIISEGVTSFKMFTSYEQGVSNGFINQTFNELAKRDVIAVMHTEDQSVIDNLTQQLKNANKSDPKWYPSSRPPYSESMSADNALRMARDAGVKYYGFHTSCRESADVIEAYQEDGTQVRGETCTHYTALTKKEYENSTIPIIAPPLRSEDDQNAMFEHLESGSLSVVSTDHNSISREKKDVDRWWESEFGSNSLQHSLPVFHDVAINERGYSYPFLVRVMSTNPARTFGFTEKGTLDVGTDADIIIFDPNKTYTINASSNFSESDYSIYENKTVTGCVEKTFVRGKLVADEGEIVADPGHGSFIHREPTEWKPHFTEQ